MPQTLGPIILISTQMSDAKAFFNTKRFTSVEGICILLKRKKQAFRVKITGGIRLVIVVLLIRNII